MDSITRYVEFGFQTCFWTNPWDKSISLNNGFPMLLTIIGFTKGSMRQVGRWVYETFIWDFRWKGSFFLHKELVEKFLSIFREHIFS